MSLPVDTTVVLRICTKMVGLLMVCQFLSGTSFI